MKIIGRDMLVTFGRKHANVAGALDVWRDTVERATWKTPHDIRAQFGRADFLPGDRIIFNIKGNHYRLVILVDYTHGRVAVEWVGTHAEYSKQTFR